MRKAGKVTKGKQPTADTAKYPFWAVDLVAMAIFPHDKHGRQTGPAEKVRDLQEAHDICEARNYPGRKR